MRILSPSEYSGIGGRAHKGLPIESKPPTTAPTKRTHASIYPGDGEAGDDEADARWLPPVTETGEVAARLTRRISSATRASGSGGVVIPGAGRVNDLVGFLAAGRSGDRIIATWRYMCRG